MTAILDRLALQLGKWPRNLALGAAVLALAAAAAFAVLKDRQALRRITQACVFDAHWTGSPFPCLKVEPSEGGGGAVIFRAPLIHDTVLVPTRKIAGVEDPFLASSAAPNFFAEAWRTRSIVRTPDGAAPAHDRLLLVVNSAVVRTQDQLHIHIGCLNPAARKSLAAAAPLLPIGGWRFVSSVVPHQPFWVLRLGRADLDGADPFRLVFEAFEGVVADPGQLTVAVAGATVAGEDDLLILASYPLAPGSWWPVGAGDVLDTRCEPEPLSEDEGPSAARLDLGSGPGMAADGADFSRKPD
jgi:CDP-diacylglycerol pyrophosphatase